MATVFHSSNTPPFVATALHGKESRVSVGTQGTFLKASDATAEQTADFADLTNFESGGATESILGVGSATWGLNAVWRSDLNPWKDPPGFWVRDDLEDLKLFGRWRSDNESTFRFWFPFATVLKASMTMPAKDVVKVSASGGNQGGFYLPMFKRVGLVTRNISAQRSGSSSGQGTAVG